MGDQNDWHDAPVSPGANSTQARAGLSLVRQRQRIVARGIGAVSANSSNRPFFTSASDEHDNVPTAEGRRVVQDPECANRGQDSACISGPARRRRAPAYNLRAAAGWIGDDCAATVRERRWSGRGAARSRRDSQEEAEYGDNTRGASAFHLSEPYP